MEVYPQLIRLCRRVLSPGGTVIAMVHEPGLGWEQVEALWDGPSERLLPDPDEWPNPAQVPRCKILVWKQV